METITQGQVLIDLIKDSNGKIRRVAEIGVWRGRTSKEILEQCHDILSQYWAIDPWVQYLQSPKRWASNEQWDEWYQNVCKLMCWFPKLHVVRMTSLNAAKLFPEEYFDLVFIDGDHFYEAVLNDIEAWLPLVRKGGLLTGHDYGKKSGVKKAVDERFGEEIEIMAPEGIWIKKVEK